MPNDKHSISRLLMITFSVLPGQFILMIESIVSHIPVGLFVIFACQTLLSVPVLVLKSPAGFGHVNSTLLRTFSIPVQLYVPG